MERTPSGIITPGNRCCWPRKGKDLLSFKVSQAWRSVKETGCSSPPASGTELSKGRCWFTWQSQQVNRYGISLTLARSMPMVRTCPGYLDYLFQKQAFRSWLSCSLLLSTTSDLLKDLCFLNR